MPEHLHLLITPAPTISLEKAIQFIKGGFSFRLKKTLDVWQRGFNETQIATTEQFSECVRYIEENPVLERLAAQPADYAYSSAHAPVDPPPSHLRG